MWMIENISFFFLVLLLVCFHVRRCLPCIYIFVRNADVEPFAYIAFIVGLRI